MIRLGALHAHFKIFVHKMFHDGFMDKDKIQIDYHEALYIEKTRNRFFAELRKLIQELPLI